MKVAPIPENEKARIEALREYNILDTLPEKAYEDITKIASAICQIPIALISLIDEDRQWFKSHHGLNLIETSRDISFCSHALDADSGIFIIKDAREDLRFSDNPLVTGSPNIVFYAGVPLISTDGFSLGTLCVIDDKLRELDQNQIDSLKALSNQVVKLFELRKKNRLLDESLAEMENRNIELQKFAYVVSHDIKSPLNNILALSEILKNEYAEEVDEAGIEMLNHLHTSSIRLKNLVDGIISYHTGDKILEKEKTKINPDDFFEGMVCLLNPKNEFLINYPKNHPGITLNEVALSQIFLNLISNGIKYNISTPVIIDISLTVDNEFYTFCIKDNGIGIEEKEIDKVFESFVTLGKKDRFNNAGTGIGLSIVKKMVEKLGGTIQLTSAVNAGSEFTFSIKK